MNSLEKVRRSKEFLESRGIEDADREAELIVAHCLGTERLILYKDNPPVPDAVLQEIDEFVKRRSGREPLQYILGYTEFHGIKIKVGPGVLIPRPETELLAEEAIKTMKRNASNPPIPPFSKGGQGEITADEITSRLPLRILDLCTGSGCVALALANEFPDAGVYGTDASEDAISYARENARINNIGNVTFLRGSLFEPIREIFTSDNSSAFDLITSNPPYIRSNDIQYLQPEIREWEPAEALGGGEDGLDYYRTIIPGAGDYLKEGGSLILEIGTGQADAVRRMAKDAGFSDVEVIRDYAGIERVVTLLKERG
jgi:release factor glutamine methyltransferase